MTEQQASPHGPLDLSVDADGAQVVPGDETLIAVPSGQPVTLQDVIWNAPGPEGLTLRFRFIAPQIAKDAGAIDFDTAVADMRALCDSYALPRISDLGPVPAQIIISFSDVPVAFGEAVPEATQFFEAFSVQDGVCIWEIF
ncbi:MAG: DUF6497 family protein [Paracoccaceae bacterium]